MGLKPFPPPPCPDAIFLSSFRYETSAPAGGDSGQRGRVPDPGVGRPLGCALEPGRGAANPGYGSERQRLRGRGSQAREGGHQPWLQRQRVMCRHSLQLLRLLLALYSWSGPCLGLAAADEKTSLKLR